MANLVKATLELAKVSIQDPATRETIDGNEASSEKMPPAGQDLCGHLMIVESGS